MAGTGINDGNNAGIGGGTNGNNKLVAYYSRAGENYFGGELRHIEVGNTEKVARTIAKATGADLFPIEQAIPYSDDYRTCVDQARQDYLAKARPELAQTLEGAGLDLSGYDQIYLGYPNYCGTMPMAVYTFLERYDFAGKTIRPFCTHEGSGLAATERAIKISAPGANVSSGLAIVGSDADKPETTSKVEDWA